MEISASLVRELREKTGAGMMECKRALADVGGDLEKAVDFLRTKGLSVAEKKAGRIASQGLVGAFISGNEGVLVELNAETDFVARNTDFQQFLNDILPIALTCGTVEQLKEKPLNGKTVGGVLTDLVARIGENLSLRRIERQRAAAGVVVPYIHTAAAPNLGKIGVLAALEGTADTAALTELGKKIAMHIAAARPAFLAVSDVDEATRAHEKDIYAEQAKASGKPPQIIEKMVEGRLRKFYEETVLTEQAFVMDPDKKVKDILAEASAKVVGFSRFALGEGLEKKADNFAEEVSKQLA